MSGSTRLIAALELHLEFAENQAERLFAIAAQMKDPKAKQDCVDLAKEAEAEAAQVRERIQELQGEA
jgi:hypothetical protein